MDRSRSSNPINENKRKNLMRSIGSFSTIEDNIIAPAPIRVPNLVSSPKVSRSRRSPQEGFFAEAGFELQSILFQQVANSHSKPPLPITNVLVLEDSPPKLESPLRASNPITFHLEDCRPSKKIAHDMIHSSIHTSSTRLYPAVGRRGTTFSRKELNRARSMSWPGVPRKIDISRTEIVAH